MNTQNEIVIYQMPNGEMQLDVTVSGETIWLTQRQIAELFGTKVPAISKHLKNIFASGELDRDATISQNGNSREQGFRGASIEIVDHTILMQSFRLAIVSIQKMQLLSAFGPIRY